jgi:hypothetical protein
MLVKNFWIKANKHILSLISGEKKLSHQLKHSIAGLKTIDEVAQCLGFKTSGEDEYIDEGLMYGFTCMEPDFSLLLEQVEEFGDETMTDMATTLKTRGISKQNEGSRSGLVFSSSSSAETRGEKPKDIDWSLPIDFRPSKVEEESIGKLAEEVRFQGFDFMAIRKKAIETFEPFEIVKLLVVLSSTGSRVDKSDKAHKEAALKAKFRLRITNAEVTLADLFKTNVLKASKKDMKTEDLSLPRIAICFPELELVARHTVSEKASIGIPGVPISSAFQLTGLISCEGLSEKSRKWAIIVGVVNSLNYSGGASGMSGSILSQQMSYTHNLLTKDVVDNINDQTERNTLLDEITLGELKAAVGAGGQWSISDVLMGLASKVLPQKGSPSDFRAHLDKLAKSSKV